MIHVPLRGTLGALLVALVAVAAPALADSPAAIPPVQGRAQTSFQDFAQSWMAKLGRAATGNKALLASPANTYRGFGSDFRTQLRATGNPAAPYVGILQYSELLYRCPSPSGKGCRVVSPTPVMEIFRFKGGRWVY